MRPSFRLFLVLLVLTSCASAQPPVVRTEVVETLGRMNGSFELAQNQGPPQYMYRSDSFRELLKRYSDDDEAVKDILPSLVECMDDVSPSGSTLSGARIPRGMMCYWFMIHLIYYEHGNEKGDIDFTWPGHILPDATLEQLRSAKRAWQKVVRERSYSIL